MLKTKKCWSVKLNRILVTVFIVFVVLVHTSIKLETNYYTFPVNPGKRSYLSGNFCELRKSHLHAGLDIKIGGVVGAPVHAAAEGYVSRIKVSWGGYGNALYVQHPNGTTTVYAHLHEFNDEIAEYVKDAQYRNKSFSIDLFPEKGELGVKRGEVIAKAGNSGSSGGPHLHFEIRDAHQQPMDPLHFRFDEIVDNVPPYIKKVALTTLDKDSRINGQYGRFEFTVRANGNQYEVDESVEVYGTIGMEVAAFDKADGVRNIYGVSKTELSLDGQPHFQYEMDKFAFHHSKNIHAHANYEERYRQDRTFYKLYVDEGNTLPVYKTGDNKGKIIIRDNNIHTASVKLYDSYGNQSRLKLNLKGKEQNESVLKVRYFSKPYNDKNYYIRGNVLQLFVPAAQGPENLYEQRKAGFYANRRLFEEAPAYVVNDVEVYLWDLRKGIPDSVSINKKKQNLGIKMRVPSQNSFSFYQPEMDIFFPKYALFDTLYIKTYYEIEADREVFTIHEDNVPLKKGINVKLKPKIIPGSKKKIAVYALTSTGNLSYRGGSWEGDMISFNTSNFGDFVLAADTIAPVVTPLNIGSSSLKFKIDDVLSGVNSFDVYVDGKWVLMHYDYKRQLIWSERLNKSVPLKGDVRLVVTDNVGNETVYTTKIG